MNKFCIIANMTKPDCIEEMKCMKEYLENAGQKCYLAETAEGDSFYRYTNADSLPEDTDCAIVLGGDGTTIHAVHDLCKRGIPVIGINMGTCGFLAQTELFGFAGAIKSLLCNDYVLESRLMIETDIFNSGIATKRYAVNDVVVTRGGSSRLVSLSVFVNGDLVGNYYGDGVILSTPTGSTGYSLSAGGPVVTPEADLMLITPICPHKLNSRSIIVSSKDEIIVRLNAYKETGEAEADAMIDGEEYIKLKAGDIVKVRRSPYDGKMVRLDDRSFFDVLYGKLEGN